MKKVHNFKKQKANDINRKFRELSDFDTKFEDKKKRKKS